MVPPELLERRDEFLAFLRHRLPTSADADDVLQQAFLAATRNAGAIQREGAAVAWFYAVLRTTLADHFRSQGRLGRVIAQLDDGPGSSLPPHELGTCACSLELLPELPASYREILTRVDVGEEPLGAVASELGLTLTNAKVRLHRARKALRDEIAACCGCKSSKECLSCKCATGCA